MVGDLAGILKALGLDEHDLELRRRVDVDDLVAAILVAVALAAAGPLVGKGARVAGAELGKIVFVFFVLILVGMRPFLQIVNESHGKNLPVSKRIVARAEDRRADAHHRRAAADGVLIIAAHAHR